LNSLRLARSAIRWGCALSQLVIVLIATWGSAYLLDRGLLLSLPSRVVVLIAWIVGMGTYALRKTVPQVQHAESLEDVALHVEHRQGIDSDLIAALQFDAAPVGAWGSPRLSTAVVEYVAAFSPSLNVFEGFSWKPLPSRLNAALGAVVVALAMCVLYPAHAAAFWNRFWLGSAHYPTRTVIASLTINGQTVPVFHSRPVQLRVAQGEMLELHAECTGDLPTDGTVEVRGIASGATALWKLPRTVMAPSGSEGAEQQPFSTFDLEPQALVENLRLRVRLGDAVTDAVDITVVVRPIIELHWRVDRSATGEQDPPVIPDGARQFAVRAGSKVALDVECLNKPLKSVTLALPSGATAFEEQTVNSRALWKLPAGTALYNVAEPLAYEIDAIDEDGLSPVPRITGQIRLRAD